MAISWGLLWADAAARTTSKGSGGWRRSAGEAARGLIRTAVKLGPVVVGANNPGRDWSTIETGPQPALRR